MQLLDRYGVKGIMLGHSIQVSRVACYLGGKLVSKGQNVNLDLLECAGLLHDVAKQTSLDTGENHIEHGYDILMREGYPEIANIVAKHGVSSILDEYLKPKTWEEKLVYYADKRVNHDHIVSLMDRFEYLRERYPMLGDELNIVWPLIRELEDEIFSIIGTDMDSDL